jgi:hypothetical protein
MKEKRLIGRREFIGLPDFGIPAIEAKVDSGAYTSALHCSVIQEETVNGAPLLRVSVLDETHPEYSTQFHSFERFERKLIKSSNGESEERYVVTCFVRMYGRRYKTRFSLTNRENLRYPVLLGRRFLKGRFVVDVAQLHVAGMPQPPKKVKVKVKRKKRKGA